MIFIHVIWRIFSGYIDISGIFSRYSGGPAEISRIQLISLTIYFAVGYVIASLNRNIGAGMPDISEVVLGVLIGSHVTYLGAKILHQGE